ncbi:uncharacterized protein LOC112324295 isoform X4 [Populus trichocarpa]|uniref:uncharacterized protein LOC112324295 isoform X4 n=1 Tax=Populus trichocarpa TaxID=3694 RepID=UPI000D18B673|nr:uncharacterized protein LOC112324295 isoform X4 [Populus trichocarpa]|eukprot:XP_024441976.1 uncharacterized protein LOC112324295 isoform X4 [Populus trichocarpa]
MHCNLGLISFIQRVKMRLLRVWGFQSGQAWSTQVYALFVGTLIIQSRVIFCGGRRVCDETRQGRILMQRQYTSNLVDSEALEARWYCSILKFQLYLAVILVFHLFWEFFEGKTIQSLILCSLFSPYMWLLLYRIPTSLYLRSPFSIHLLLFVNQISGRENKHKVVERMMRSMVFLNH